MARLLHCPYCLADFPFADWQRAATCPNCDRRLTFFEASGQAAPSAEGGGAVAPAPRVAPAPQATTAPGATPPGTAASGTAALASPAAGDAEEAEAIRAARAAAIAQAPMVALPTIVDVTSRATTVPMSPGAHPDGTKTFFGKPLAWSRGWTVVVVIWLVAAAGFTAIRLEMGHLTALNNRERAAITTVEHGQLEPGVSYGHALDLLASRVDPLASLAGSPNGARWYVFDRSWENRLYVYWQLPGYQPLVWTVQGNTPAADSETMLVLKAAVQGSLKQRSTTPAL